MVASAVEFFENRSDVQLPEMEMEAARSSLTRGGAQRVVIGLAFKRQDRPSNPGIIVDIVGPLLGLAVDRLQVHG
ncbi:hypothetical protein [Rhizobium mesoamericanum]|uniref:Uncharacterized protein n=1 Tax=Rhizobium mesoamericanum STM3625 TaxID=1211777 RepID=K0PFQ7_9HYPH|nr:hypothetical protein [Rhizobium mesoamericanum]CCM75336.1 hypothetical protein BN77_2479 [Rhizobium mesoamericanum STM3625]